MNNKIFIKWLVVTAVALVFGSSCSNENISTIKGNISNADKPIKLSLLKQSFAKTETLESVEISARNKSFKFKAGELNEPTFFQLRFKGDKSRTVVLLLEPGDKAVVEIDMQNFDNYTVTGSKESLKTQSLAKRLAQTVNTLDSINVLMSKATSNTQKQQLAQEYEVAIEKQREFSSQFIWDNPMSRASVMALYQKVSDDRFVFDRAEDVQLFKVVGSSLVARYPDSDYAKGMLRDIQNQEKILMSHQLQELVKNVESTLPELALPNPQGDTVRLSSFKGKVILLDFWGSFNQDNLLENRELLQLYKKYKNQGFEIYQVSLDVEREAWLAAIESANLPWVNVSELNPNGSSAARLYNVNRLPANYLINRNYDIVAKNVYGRNLESKLKEIL